MSETEYGQAGSTIPLTEFEQLLDRLEGSKKRQKRQEAVENRRGTFAQGLAGMMSNFWVGLFRWLTIQLQPTKTTIGLILTNIVKPLA